MKAAGQRPQGEAKTGLIFSNAWKISSIGSLGEFAPPYKSGFIGRATPPAEPPLTSNFQSLEKSGQDHRIDRIDFPMVGRNPPGVSKVRKNFRLRFQTLEILCCSPANLLKMPNFLTDDLWR
ncbi:MAG: hypothetical protein WC047_07025 [Kiritimatiellales bacterium]